LLHDFNPIQSPSTVPEASLESPPTVSLTSISPQTAKMADKIDMSLDDIIKKNKSARGGGGAKRGAGRGPRGVGRVKGGAGGGGGATPAAKRGGGGGARGTGRRGGGAGGRRGGISRAGSRTTPSGKWSHDMYDGPKRSAVLSTGGPGKLVVSNLDFGVSDSDINELFSEFGKLKTAAVHYDRSGRSLGTADVVFDRKSDAVKAMKQYNGVPLDGRPMQIAMAASAQEVQNALTSPVQQRIRPAKGAPERRKSGGGGRVQKKGASPAAKRGAKAGRGAKRGAKGGRGGAAGGGGKPKKVKEPAPTAEELDKELDTYLKAR